MAMCAFIMIARLHCPNTMRRELGKLNRRRSKFAAGSLNGDIEPRQVEAYQQKQAELQQEIEQLEQKVSTLKAARKETKKRITVGELSEKDRFKQLSTQSKYLIDAIKMIAYRAETSMANVCRETMSRPDDVRSLLRAIYSGEADLLVDRENKTLTVQLHHIANPMSSRTIQQLCEELTATETIFPGTELTMIYKMVSNLNR
jgi:septal ring factor EnvC (AmiA/AmiB activator)